MNKKTEEIRIQMPSEDMNPVSMFWMLLHEVRKRIRANNYDKEGRLKMQCLSIMREAELLLYDPKTGVPLSKTEEHYCCMQAFLALRSLVF